MAQKKDITEKQVMFTALQKTLSLSFSRRVQAHKCHLYSMRTAQSLILCLRAPEQLLAKRSQQQSQSPHSP